MLLKGDSQFMDPNRVVNSRIRNSTYVFYETSRFDTKAGLI